MGQAKRTRVQVKIARKPIHRGAERVVLVGPRVFHVAEDRRADRDAMDTELVGAPGQRPQFQPRQLLPGMIERAVVRDGARGIRVGSIRDFGALAAGPADAPQR